jgi:hypothetical protein
MHDNLAFVQKRFGKENVVGFALHQDEITPHIHCVVVPVTANGRLSCRDVFSPTSLRQLQTDYAEAMQPHGLTRGIHYSTARHEDVRRHYGAQQMSQDELRELARPVQTQCHQIRSRAEIHDEVTYRDIERMRLAKAWGELLVAANHKITQLAAIATSNALAHERAKVLERQLVHSQELLAKKSAEFTMTAASLTKQLQETVQERDKQQVRAEEQLTLHKRAVIRHSQSQPLAERYVPMVQKLRQQHQQTLEQALATRLRSPVSNLDELAAVLVQVGKGYSVKAASGQELSFISKQDGTRFSSTELRPGGQPFHEQYLRAVQRTQQNLPPLLRDRGEIEM